MRPWIVLAGLNGLVAIGMGAYGAHGLAGDPVAQAWTEQASHYQLIHALALAIADRVANGTGRRGGCRLAHGAAALFLLGMVLFCGSLYAKALGWSLPMPMVTPAGGMALMAAWFTLALSGLRQ